MAETHVVSGLKAKEEEIKKRILGLRKEIKACQDDLEAIRKALRIFGENWRAGGSRLFRRGEMSKVVFDALRTNPDGLDVDELAGIVIRQEGFDLQDKETISTIRQRCLIAMYRHCDRGKIAKERGPNGTRIWRLAH